jgi:PKD repeat protein
MVRPRLVRGSLLWLLCSLPLPACHTRSFVAGDGGLDAPGADAPSADLPGPLALDFAVTGCAHYDVGVPRCTGLAPLTVSFSPVSSAALTRFLWSFGDGTSSSSERAPTHTYALPGTYDVGVIGDGKVGSVSRTRPQLVEVSPVGAGVPCDVDAQCAKDLRCLCGAASACGPYFSRGICTSACPASGCGAGAVCAALAVPVPAAAASTPDAGTDARDGGDASPPDAGPGETRTPLCLGACTDDASCPAGLVCRALPAAGKGQGRWALACVPPSFRDVGDTCRAATGTLDDGSCATGTCADLGALGLCSAACGGGAECPAGSACATLGTGQALCLRTCSDVFLCAHDPLLRCEAPGSAGALGFQLSPPVASATFCAPRRCGTPADCEPAGTCAPLGAGGHCQRP